MTDTNWRLAGTIGTTEENTTGLQEQVMTQGLGFPLRPVDGAPPQDTGEYLNPETVASGDPMQWVGAWQEGKYHVTGSVVTNGEFQMIADTLTLEYPFPTPEGTPTWSVPSFTPATQSNNSVVYSGHRYTITQSVYATRVRVWVTELSATTNYRLVIGVQRPGEANPTVSTIEGAILTEDAWAVIGAANTILPVGTEIILYVDALNSGSDTLVTGGWAYAGTSQSTAPPAQGWNRDNQNIFVRIDKTDLDGTDRSTELTGIIPDSELLFTDTATPDKFSRFRVAGANTDFGTYIQYPVVLLSEGLGGPDVLEPSTLTATVPVSQPTQYAEQAGTVPNPAWATATGYLAYDGVEQPAGVNNTYGVDLEADISTAPTDWSIFSVTTL